MSAPRGQLRRRDTPKVGQIKPAFSAKPEDQLKELVGTLLVAAGKVAGKTIVYRTGVVSMALQDEPISASMHTVCRSATLS